MNSLLDEYANIMSGGGEVPEPPKDTTPPTVSIEVGETTETSIAVTVNATDDSGEIAKYIYHINGKEPQENTTNTYKYDGLTAGTEYTIKVEAYDKANNKGEKTITASTKKSYPTIEEKLKEGDYVNYIDGKEETRKCVVLYDNTSSYGVQIITMDTVENITLGSSDFTTAMNSYNNAINTLNSKAGEYNNSIYSHNARCVGSVPNDKNHESGMYKTQFGGNYDGKLRDSDNNFETDYNKMKEIRGGIQNIGKGYWLASRLVYSSSTVSHFRVWSVIISGGLHPTDTYDDILCGVTSNGRTSNGSYCSGLRPVFILKSGIKVTGGDGSENSAYTLGV